MNEVQKSIRQSLWRIASVQFHITSYLFSSSKRNSLTNDLEGRKKKGGEGEKNRYPRVLVHWARETGV